MGLLARLHEESRAFARGPLSLKDPALAELFGAGARTLAGPIVNEATAYTASAFWDGVQQISGDVAKLPLNLHQRIRGGRGSDVMVQHPTHRLLKHGPNPETQPLVFRRTLTAHALVYGNGYAEIVRDDLGRPRALWILHPKRVRPFYPDQPTRPRPQTRTPLRYKIDGEIELEPRNILHIRGLSDDGVAGFNLVRVARDALGLALASEQFAAAFFGNGTRFGGVLTADHDLTQEQADDVRTSVEALHAKADKAFRLLVLGAGFTYHEAATKPSDAQMKEIRDQQVMEVARFLNLPLHKLKLAVPGAVSYASVEMADLDYYKGPILTWIATWEEELNAKLVPSLEWGIQFWKHNTNAFLRGDIKSRYEALGIARDKGIINADEWRDLEDMNPQEGGQGALYLVQSAQVPLARLDEIVDSQVASPEPPPPPAEPTPDSEETEDRIRELEEALADTEGRLAEAQASVRAVTESLERVQTELSAVESAAGETTAAQALRIEELVSERDLLRERKDAEHAIEAFVSQQASQLEADIARLSAERDRVEAARQAEQAAAAEAEAEQRTAFDALKADYDRALAELEEVVARRDALTASLEADREAWEQQRDAAEAAVTEAEASRAAEVDVLTAERDRVLADLETVAARRDELESAQSGQMRRLNAAIESYREVLEYTGARLARRAANAAKQKRATPDRLARWLTGFPELHTDIALSELTPVIRAKVALCRLERDAAEIVADVAAAHVSRFVGLLEQVIAGDPDDFDRLFERAISQWEAHEPGRMADAVAAERLAEDA